MFKGDTAEFVIDSQVRTTVENLDKATKVEHVKITDYETLVKRDLNVVEKRKRNFSSDEYVKNYSNAMELIFTDLAYEIFGSGFEILIPSEVDDLQNGADLIVLKRDQNGSVEGIFSIDFFVGIAGEKTDSEFLRQKLFQGLNRVQIGYVTNINYVESRNKEGGIERFSATNLSSLILPISASNLEKLAGMYYKGENNIELLGEVRDSILESFQGQIRLKKKIANEIKPKRYFDRKLRKTVTEDNRPLITNSLKNLETFLPRMSAASVSVKDTMLTQTQRIIAIFNSNFQAHMTELTGYGLAQRDKIRARRNKSE